ncbi:MAG: hypothetical protein ACYS80_10780 [Planctomycetota bacterium]|jgi:hypothetical protein
MTQENIEKFLKLKVIVCKHDDDRDLALHDLKLKSFRDCHYYREPNICFLDSKECDGIMLMFYDPEKYKLTPRK